MIEHAIAHTDGGQRKEISGYSVYIEVSASPSNYIVEISEPLPKGTTTPVAEYTGLIAALDWAVKCHVEHFEVIMDAELVVRHMNGLYECKAPHLRPLYEKAIELSLQIREFSIHHVRRIYNVEADRLVNEAMDRGINAAKT